MEIVLSVAVVDLAYAVMQWVAASLFCGHFDHAHVAREFTAACTLAVYERPVIRPPYYIYRRDIKKKVMPDV